MTAATKPNISYGKGRPTAATSGDFYKDLDTDTMYQRTKSNEWEVRQVQPRYKMYVR